jgi:glycolate oxidase iron-sulfur subunit
MNEALYLKELSKCVRCGACKTLCPTYLSTLNETMGARGRVAMLGELAMKHFTPTRSLADKIFSCMLCGACKNICPTGIDIPEVIYQGRARLKDSYKKGRISRAVLNLAITRLDTVFTILRAGQSLFYKPLHSAGLLGYVPDIASKPFNKNMQVLKSQKNIGRVAIFAGCSVNYFYPGLGSALSGILLSRGYEVVVFKDESCCGAPLRSMGLEQEASGLAKRNIDHFNKVRAEAIISMCPTCTMVIKEQYPLLTGNTINNIMDINEFIINYNIAENLRIRPTVLTYHDPCHLNYGMGIRNEPRQILTGIEGIKLLEMPHSDDCCGFAGFFSLHYSKISEDIGRKKLDNISGSGADTVVTSCPGCIMQLVKLGNDADSQFRTRHVLEVIYEAMQETE